MSLLKRARKAAHRVVKKTETVAKKAETASIKASTPFLSKKTQGRLVKTVSEARGITERAGRLVASPTKGHITAFKSSAKTVGRNVARVSVKPVIYATGGLTAAASYFFTPLGGAAVGAGLSEADYYVGSTAARAKGLHGRAARHAGRVERKKAIKTSLIGLSLGGGAAALGSAIAGSGAAAGVGSGASAIVGSGAAGSISSIGSSVLGAAGKIVPAIIQHEEQASASRGGTAGAILRSSAPGGSDLAAAPSLAPGFKVAAIALLGILGLALAS